MSLRAIATSFTALTYQGTWNASTNTPTLTSSVGTSGYYYVVSVAGTTNLNGITTWSVGDWAVFNGTAWQKVDGSTNETFNSITVLNDATIHGLTVGEGGGSDSSSTAVGLNALASNSTGNSNTGIGWYALTSNTSGIKNIAVGGQALNSNTIGSDNTAVGFEAGYSNTSGASLAAFGYQALYNSTGNYNSAFGSYALVNNTTASNNTAVGYQAGYSNTTGTQIVAIGGQAGFSNVSSNYGTYVGYYAGYYATGASNTFVGNGAGYEVTSGNNNTIIGTFNGNQNGLNITTTSNYIVLSDGQGNPKLSVNNSWGGEVLTGPNVAVAVGSTAGSTVNGAVFTITGGANGAGGFLEIEVTTYQGYLKVFYQVYNNSGSWTVSAQSTITNGTAPTFTVAGSGTATATITVACTTNYNPYMMWRRSNAYVSRTT